MGTFGAANGDEKYGYMMMKALILTGGKSSRMGKDKFKMEINGRPQYQHLSALLQNLGLEVWYSCNSSQVDQLSDVSDWLILDQYEDIGPIGGIYSAMDEQPEVSWLVVACDLIALDESAISQLIQAHSTDVEMITYCKEGSNSIEPTLSIYNPSCFDEMANAIEEGSFGLQKVSKCWNTKKIMVPSNSEYLRNANYPYELRN